MFLFISLYIIYAFFGLILSSKKNATYICVGNKASYHWSVDTFLTGICFFYMFLICGLRSIQIGTDTISYVESFINPDVLNRSVDGGSKFEPGYKLLVQLIRLFTDNEQVFIFVVTAIIFFGIYLFIRNNCYNNYFIGTLIFISLLYYTTFSAIRQSLALAIAINCMYFLKKKKSLKALVVIFIGGLFHFTALILLVLVPLSLKGWNNKKIVITIVGSLIGTIAFEQIVEVVLRFFPIYQRYWNSSQMMNERSDIGIFAILVIILCVFSVFSMMTGRAQFETEEEKSDFILFVIGSVLVVFINMMGKKYGVFSRMSRYFIPFVMVQCADVYRYCINRHKVIFYFLVAVIMGGYYYTIMNVDLYQLIPYTPFWG